jgi:hypothetical protein
LKSIGKRDASPSKRGVAVFQAKKEADERATDVRRLLYFNQFAAASQRAAPKSGRKTTSTRQKQVKNDAEYRKTGEKTTPSRRKTPRKVAPPPKRRRRVFPSCANRYFSTIARAASCNASQKVGCG